MLGYGKVTGEWEYDDSNYTNLPEATADLVDGQRDYELPSTAQKIDRVEVLDNALNSQKLSNRQIRNNNING